MPLFLLWIILAYVMAYSDIHSNGVSAVQQAAAAGMGVMAMFLPYAIVRLVQTSETINNQRKIIELLGGDKPQTKVKSRMYFWKNPN